MNTEKNYSEKEYLDIIKSFIEKTKFGQITIILQNGKVVQIEQTKKIRFKN
ncbi:MAG: YezD family protein [Clostridiales bacterium]|nr:YezD family protein [Clostridiales bacterium]MCD8159495.1 YezD family protein [Clostridiales bacterium]